MDSGQESSDSGGSNASPVRQKRTRREYVLVGIYSSVHDALLAMRGNTSNEYKVYYNYGKKGNGQRVYRCITHRECGRLYRVGFTFEEEEKVVTLEETGDHTSVLSGETKTGIPLPLKRSSDDLLSGGAGGLKCHKILAKRASSEISTCVPTEKQLNNRKAYLKRKSAGGWEIANNATLLEWAAGKMCESTDSFFGPGAVFQPDSDAETFAAKPSDFRHDLLVLKSFKYEAEDDKGVSRPTFGVIVTSRTCFRNIVYTHRGQTQDNILGVTDGTYKLHFGGWTLVDFGTYTTHFVKGRYSKTFVPWVYMFVRTENQKAYTEMFATTKGFAQELFNIDLTLRFGSLDRTSYIANAFQSVWPTIVLLNCYPHLARKARSKGRLLKKEKFFDTDIWPDIQYLHEARSKQQFDALCQLFVAYWREKKEEKYADWLSEIYLSGSWSNWYGTCATPGVTPSQNALEAHHRVIKQACVSGLRGSTAIVLNDSLPNILFHQSTVPSRMNQGHFCEGPFLSEVVTKARRILNSEENFYYVRATRKKTLKAIVFNASKYIVDGKNAHGNQVTRERVNRFLKSIGGELYGGVQPKPKVNQVELRFLSLHRVELFHLKPLAISVQASISTKEIISIREKYRCDCLGFWQTGWQCSHTVAAMVRLKDLEMDGLDARLLVRKIGGGQKKNRGPLCEDRSTQAFFSVENLVRLFLEFPARPLHWNVLREVLAEDGESETRAGVVMTWTERDGIFLWTVKLSNGVSVKIECEELAESVNRAYMLGLDVTTTIHM